jgi:mono/diheme cytochrome c family protein
MSRLAPTLFILFVAADLLSSAETKPTEAEVAFAIRVLPVLKARCFACHGADSGKIEGELNLTSRAMLLKGGASKTPAIVAGKAMESPLYKAITRASDDFRPMPPKENDKLSDADVKAFKQWIDGGAPWPSAERVAEIVKAVRSAGVLVKTSGGLTPEWTNRSYKPENLWAYQPLRKPTLTDRTTTIRVMRCRLSIAAMNDRADELLV